MSSTLAARTTCRIEIQKEAVFFSNPTKLARLLAVALAVCGWKAVPAAAQGVFGNAPVGGNAFAFVANGGSGSGGAVGFTPAQSLTFASVTVWLDGYTGLDMYGNLNQSFSAGIYADSVRQIGPATFVHEPGAALLTLATPPPNDGTPAAFNFANPSAASVFQAGTTYWLFIYELTGGSVNYYNYPQWASGGAPAGAAAYNGSLSFAQASFSASSATPAFQFNAVPEPGAGALLLVGGLALAWLGWQGRRGVH